MSNANSTIYMKFVGDGSLLAPLPSTTLSTVGTNVAKAGASYDFSVATLILPVGFTIQLRHGAYSELQTITLSSGEPGWTTDTHQLFVGDGSTVGGIEASLERFPTIWSSGTLNALLGTPSKPNLNIIDADSNTLTLNIAAGGEWIPLLTFQKETPNTVSTFDAGASLIGACLGANGSGTGVAGSGTSGSGGRGPIFNFPNTNSFTSLMTVGLPGFATGGNASGSGHGGNAGDINCLLAFIPGSGGNSTGAGNGGSGGSHGDFPLLFNIGGGQGGTGNASNGGDAGNSLFSLIYLGYGSGGNGGSFASSSSGGKGGGTGGGGLIFMTCGNGGNGGTVAASQGGNGGLINGLSFASGNGGNGSSFQGGNGGDSGDINLSGGNGGDGSGSSKGGTGAKGIEITGNGGDGNINSKNGGRAGKISLNGGSATSSAAGGLGGDFTANANATFSAGSINLSATASTTGGSISLTSGTNNITTSGSTQYTWTLPTSTSSGEIASLPIMTANTTSTISFNNNKLNETIYNTSSSTISSATITLPTTSLAGQIIRYVSAGSITSITLAGGTVDIGAALTTLAANGSLAWQSDSSGHWIRLS